MSERKYETFIPEEAPLGLMEKKGFKSPCVRIIDEFSRSDVQSAYIKEEILKYYKSSISAARAIGRVIKSMKLEDKIRVYSKDDRVWLIKI